MAASATSVVTGLLAKSVDTVEIRSRFSPPIILRIKDLLSQQEGPPHPAVRLLKPTIILKGDGIGGTQIIAPAGQATRDEWQWWALATGALTVVGAVTVLGMVFRLGKRSGRTG